ncbi:MAG: hypothetical protein EA374_01205 [Acholeplasmatales bacterium]|nr:MAG: hypothetical protein EA374_01205 [Acholeplasmatales bacterium]
MNIIDAFESMATLGENLDTVDSMLSGWRNHMQVYPEVFTACTMDYTENGYDWETIARERVFPYSLKHWSCLKETYARLKPLCHGDTLRGGGFSDDDLPQGLFVLYHGLGNGAGWAHEYAQTPAIWLGIEKICELGWTSEAALRALIVHEGTHLWHAQKRGITLPMFAKLCEHPVFRLVAEGLAMVHERRVVKAGTRSADWYKECARHFDALKHRFALALSHDKEACAMFFGDWHSVEGLPDTGYYLGEKLVDSLTTRISLEEIATMSLPTLIGHSEIFMRSTH